MSFSRTVTRDAAAATCAQLYVSSETLQSYVADEVRVRVSRQHADVLDAPQRLDDALPLGCVALPAVVGQREELHERHLVDDHLERRRRSPHVAQETGELACAEHRSGGIGDSVAEGLETSSRPTFPARGARVQSNALVDVTSPAATP